MSKASPPKRKNECTGEPGCYFKQGALICNCPPKPAAAAGDPEVEHSAPKSSTDKNDSDVDQAAAGEVKLPETISVEQAFALTIELFKGVQAENEKLKEQLAEAHAEVERFRAALERILEVVGTSTLQHKIAREALKGKV